MSFIVTARKWRPQKFSDVVGQEHITTTLKNAIRNNRIAHAYLFTGPRGVGKTTTARILAKTLNCTNSKDAEPCNECEMCRTIQTSQLMDIIEIDGASNRGIDEVRALRDSVKYTPTKGKYKVYIIDEVHMLTRESFNAFLKTLEEPPSHTIFIFATTDAHKVPPTIISRCQRFDFRRIQLDSIKILLRQIAESEKIQIDDKTLTIIAKKADGALRDAESIFDQVVSFCGNNIDPDTVAKMLNLINDEVFFRISDAVLEKNFKTVFEVSDTIYENGWDFVDFTEGLIEHFRNILAAVITEKTELIETADEYRKKYLQYIDKFSQSDLLRLLNFLNKVHQELKYSQNHKLKVEISLSHLIGFEKSSTISELISNLNSGKIGIEVKENSPSSFFLKDHEFSTPKAINEPGKNYSLNSAIHQRKPFTEEIEKPDLSFDSIVKKWEGFIK
jgi:DNA polymerase-3 subunit gamma/tau